MNLVVSAALLIVLPLSLYFLAKRSKNHSFALKENKQFELTPEIQKISGSEKLDHSRIPAYIFGFIILWLCFHFALIKPPEINLAFITPNYINFLLLGLCVVFHGSFFRFLNAVDSAITGASGILIQFPLYFGIMGIMNDSGLVLLFSDFFVKHSTETTFPIFTFISAGIVNIFVPSGGGQWAVQGPIIVEAANQLGVSVSKSVMALAYGDQITNMLQPFWALPLLGITGLKAKEMLPYTLYLMLIGIVIFTSGLLIF